MIPNSLKQELSTNEMIDGWTTPEKQEAMAEIILRHRPVLSIEVGVFGGRSLVAQAVAIRHAGIDGGAVWGIDPWTSGAAIEGDIGQANVEWWSKINLDKIRDDCLNGISRRLLWPWVRIIVAHSADCIGLFNGIDMLHIDGNHSEECSTRDVLGWLPRVKPGGFIWFDDADWSTTKHAVSILEDQCKMVLTVGGCRLYQLK